jgi:RNA polymerase sigma-70 factor (ECF subfamily)
VTGVIEETLRIEGGRVLATLIRATRDFQLAEDALQDAIESALTAWRRHGVPDNPAAWLTTVSRRKALDRLRREAARRRKEAAAVTLPADDEESWPADDRLRLIFTCCHPALAPEARVALTLRTISGLTTSEIARAFLVPESTMAQRLTRAKRKIAVAHIPYRIPDAHELPDRLPSVLSVVYLVFTTGHHPPEGGAGLRVDLAEEAIRLGRLLAGLMPDEPEVLGLLALMLATHARWQARLDPAGEMVLLADQDRSRWDRAAISEAAGLVERTLRRHRPGPYQVQAAIACLHGLAAGDADTDWRQIVDLYRILETMTPTPVVRTNRAVAEAKVFGPRAGLEVLAGAGEPAGWHLYWATEAELRRQAGDLLGAAAAYRRALGCHMNDADRRFLVRRLSELEP